MISPLARSTTDKTTWFCGMWGCLIHTGKIAHLWSLNEDFDTGRTVNKNLLDGSRHAPWSGQAGGGAAYDSNKMGGVRTGWWRCGWRVAGPGLSTAGDCQWEEDCSQYPLSRRTRSTRDTWQRPPRYSDTCLVTRGPRHGHCVGWLGWPQLVCWELGRGGAGLWLFVGLMLMLCTLLPRLHKRLKVSAKFCGSFRTFSMMKAPTTTTKNVFVGGVMLSWE